MANFQLQSLISPKTGNLKGKDNKGKDGEDEEEPNIISASRSALLVRRIYDFITTTRCMAGSTCEMRRESFLCFAFALKLFHISSWNGNKAPDLYASLFLLPILQHPAESEARKKNTLISFRFSFIFWNWRGVLERSACFLSSFYVKPTMACDDNWLPGKLIPGMWARFAFALLCVLFHERAD